MSNLTYDQFVKFVLRMLPNYKLRYHVWTKREQAVLDEVVFCVRMLSSCYTDIQSFTAALEVEFGLMVPIAWGTYSEPYFKNWHRLHRTWNLIGDKI